MSRYAEFHQRSITDPDGFWAEQTWDGIPIASVATSGRPIRVTTSSALGGSSPQ